MNLNKVISIFSYTILVISKDIYNKSAWGKEYKELVLLGSRFRRDARGLENSIKQMKMIARLTNGIYLQKGFIEGSIPPDDFISELFRFGSVTPSEIKLIDVENIQKAMHALQTLPNELQKNQNFDEIEHLFDSIRKILTKIDKIGSIAEWNEKDDFIRDIKSMASKGIDFTVVHELKDALKSWSHENEKLTEDPRKFNDHVALGALISLHGYTENMISALKRLPSILQDVKFVSIETATGALHPIFEASEEIGKLSNDVAKLQKAAHVRADNVTDFLSFSEVAEKLNPIISHLTSIRTIVVSRSIKKQELKYTHGFLDGEQDILRIFGDLKDPWMQNVVNGVDFSKPLEKLEAFGELAVKTEESLSFLDDAIVLQSFEKLLTLSNSVLEVFSKSENFKKSISNILQCVSIIPRKINSETLFKLKNAAIQIDELMNQLKLNVGKLIQFSEESNAVKLLDEVLKIVEKATDLNTVADVVKHYNMNPNSKDLVNFIENSSLIIQKFFDPIDKSKKLEELVMAVESKLGYLNNYHEMLKNYSTFFQCLQNIAGLDSSFKTISLIKYIRKLETDDLGFIDDGMKVVEKISEVSKKLEDLERSINQMKNYASVETDALKIFENASLHSKVIGSATRGISVMKQIIDQPELELNVSVILEQLNKVYPPLSKEDIGNLNEIISLKSELFIMYNSLEEFQNNIQEQHSPHLFNHSEIFQKAGKVIGIQGNVTNMIRSVETLAERVTDIKGSVELFTLREHLEKIENSGIQFSEYTEDFKDSQDTLAALDLFFADYSKMISDTATSNSEVEFLNASTTSTVINTTKTPLYLEGYIGWSLFLLVVLASVGALSYASYIFMCKKKSARKTSKKKEDIEE